MSLPNVYANKIDKKIDNNELYHRTNATSLKKDAYNLKSYFANGYANHLIVNITTKDGTSRERLILDKGEYFININNKRIYIKDIIDYNIEN